MENGKQRTHARVPSKPLVDFMHDEGMSCAETGGLLGITSNGVATWARVGSMPKIALVALEGLKRRRQIKQAQVLIGSVKEDSVPAVVAFLKAINVPYRLLDNADDKG